MNEPRGACVCALCEALYVIAGAALTQGLPSLMVAAKKVLLNILPIKSILKPPCKVNTRASQMGAAPNLGFWVWEPGSLLSNLLPLIQHTPVSESVLCSTSKT